MSTDQSNPYLFRGLLCAIAVIGLIIAVCLYPHVYENYLYKTTTYDVFEAARIGTVKDIKYFMNRGATVNDKDLSGTSLIHYAASYNPDVEVMKYLVEQGADVNTKTKGGTTPLHCAAYSSNSNIDILKYLIEQGADVNAKEINGTTPLDTATGDKEKEAILREAGGKRGEELQE